MSFCFQSFVNTQKLYVEQIWKMSFCFQSVARFNNTSLDCFWNMTFWFSKLRNVSQNINNCTLSKSGKCHVVVLSFASFNNTSIDRFSENSFWDSNIRNISNVVSWANLDTCILIFDVSHGSTICLLIVFGKWHAALQSFAKPLKL